MTDESRTTMVKVAGSSLEWLVPGANHLKLHVSFGTDKHKFSVVVEDMSRSPHAEQSVLLIDGDAAEGLFYVYHEV